MITNELTTQLHAEARRLKEVQDQFLRTFEQACIQCAGPQWRKEGTEMVFHRVRSQVVPILEQAGIDAHAVQGLCSLAERLLMSR